jgi:soluble lytic murein transglycosylase
MRYLACPLAALMVLVISSSGCHRRQPVPQSAVATTPPVEEIAPGASGGQSGLAESQHAEDRYRDIPEYLRLFEARGRLPDLDAIQELRAIIVARPHSPAAYEAHVAMARHYAALGDPAAEDEYRAALALENQQGLRLELARWLEEQDRADAAYVEYKALLRQYPQAFEAMRRVGSDPLTVAQDLLEASYYSDALETLRGVEDPAAEVIRAEALSGLGRHDEAALGYRIRLESHPADAEAKMGLARVLQQQGSRDEALSLYESVDTADSLLAQAQLWASEEPTRAISLYLQCPYPVAKWEATGLLEEQGRLTETLPLYAELATGETGWADDAAYRLYLLADRLGDSAERDRARRLLHSAQPNFLALRLGDEWEPIIVPSFRPAGGEVLSKTMALESQGFQDLAYRELAMAARFDGRPQARTAYAQSLFERGYLVEAQQVAERTLSYLSKAPLTLWQLAYPRPYEQYVRAAAEEFDVDPLLLWAIMHTESRYDPEALSWARAQGLMQLIPSTAEWAAESADPLFTPLDVYDPQTNIRLGAWYMRWLLDYFDGDLELAVTAYNGGPGNASTWDEQVSRREDFFRWISYGESREYVNRVFTAYHVYRQLERLSSGRVAE